MGTLHRILQGCLSTDGIVLSVLELHLAMAVGGWDGCGLLATALHQVEQPLVEIKMKGGSCLDWLARCWRLRRCNLRPMEGGG